MILRNLAPSALEILEEWIDDLPRGFDFVASCEERLVADHDIDQQSLICGRGCRLERFRVREVHVNWRYLEVRRELVLGSWSLHVEAQGYSFVGLNSHDER